MGFRLVGLMDNATLAEVRVMLHSGRPVDAIRLIRERTNSGLADAKATYEHVTIARGYCRQCNASLTGELLSDCSSCRALNIDA
jgi:hypothetical protein